jgi:hypothetical protein
MTAHRKAISICTRVARENRFPQGGTKNSALFFSIPLEGQAAPQNSFISIELAGSNPTLSAILLSPPKLL